MRWLRYTLSTSEKKFVCFISFSYICRNFQLMMASIGININDGKEPWTDFILSGKKTVETRNRNSLKSLVGKPVGVIRTGVGKAHVIGFIRLGAPIVYTSLEQFRADEELHGIHAGSSFDWNGKKYGYPVEVLAKLEVPIPVDSFGISFRKIQPYEISEVR